MINSAYNTLTPGERATVNQYVNAVEQYAKRHNELIIHALNRPIPPDVVARSRGVLEKPLVLAAIHDKIKELSDKKDLSATRILREHINLAMSNMADFINYTDTGQPYVDLKNCTREQMAAVKSVKVANTLFGVTVSFELHSKQASLDALGKMMGLDQPDNSVYLKHISAPKDIKPLPVSATLNDAEKSYTNLLEAIK